MEHLSNQAYWDDEWERIFDRYQRDTRFAYYVYSILNAGERVILEIGAGSYRDMAKLNEWGLECHGLDFSDASVQKARIQFPEYKDLMFADDAFQMPFSDKYFDVSYHNGFWGCFSDDQIVHLGREQARVTRGRMIAAVHNAHNQEFVDYFKRLQIDDPLYRARFFTIDEIDSAMRRYCSDVAVIPVGKQKKYYEDYLINLGLGTRENLRKCFRYHKDELLKVSERLLCIGTVESNQA